jgi:predicted nuclease of predicted toxin-antitoxin system
MKLLLDQNISFRVVEKISWAFPGSMHISNLGLRNKKDIEIWKYAKDKGFAIVTFDADFYNFSLIYGNPPKIIWIKAGNLTTNQIAELLILQKGNIKSFLMDLENQEEACLAIRP